MARKNKKARGEHKYATSTPLLKNREDIIAVINKDRQDVPRAGDRYYGFSKPPKQIGVSESNQLKISETYNPHMFISSDGTIITSGRYSRLHEDYDDD